MDCFLNGLTGRIVVPSDSEYDELRQGYNRAVQKYPCVIVYCFETYDVINAVKWARKQSMPIRIRSGGHNYEGFSSGDGVLIIDLSQMNNVKLDKYLDLVYVQGGATNKDVYEAVSSKGYPFPGGTCPTVGVGGYVTGGGWGLSCRYLGLGCDSLEEIEIVNYEGNLIKANNYCNSDLFWACRGAGGGNFGVIVGMTFKLPKKIDEVTLVEIDYIDVSSDEQEEFIKVWQNWLKTADNRITLISRIYNSDSDGLSMLIRGIYYGKSIEVEEMLSCFLKLKNAEFNFEYVPFLEAVKIIGSAYPDWEMFKSASRYVLNDFCDYEISNIVSIIKERAEGSVYAGLSMYSLGGKVAEVSSDDTAFFYRNANFIIWLETVWDDNKFINENVEWINHNFPYLKVVTEGSYVNFPYAELNDYLNEYYGCHKYILEKIKEKYDPLNVFTFKQGIIPMEERKEMKIHKRTLINKENNWKLFNDTNHREFRYVRK